MDTGGHRRAPVVSAARSTAEWELASAERTEHRKTIRIAITGVATLLVLLVCNPVLREEKLTERWPIADYNDFRRVVIDAAALTEEAIEARPMQAAKKWQELLGSDFPAPAPAAARAALDPGEMDLELDYAIPTRISGTVTIDGRVAPRSGFRHGPIVDLSPLQKGRQLYFKLRTTTVSPPFDVYWRSTSSRTSFAWQLNESMSRSDKANRPSRPWSRAPGRADS